MAHKRLHTFTSSTEHDFTGLLQNQILIFDGDNIVSTGSTNTSGNIWSSSTGQHSIISNNNSNNIASGGYSVSFGYNNSINDGDSSSNSFVGGGSNNEIEGMNSSVIGFCFW